MANVSCGNRCAEASRARSLQATAAGVREATPSFPQGRGDRGRGGHSSPERPSSRSLCRTDAGPSGGSLPVSVPAWPSPRLWGFLGHILGGVSRAPFLSLHSAPCLKV